MIRIIIIIIIIIIGWLNWLISYNILLWNVLALTFLSCHVYIFTYLTSFLQITAQYLTISESGASIRWIAFFGGVHVEQSVPSKFLLNDNQAAINFFNPHWKFSFHLILFLESTMMNPRHLNFYWNIIHISSSCAIIMKTCTHLICLGLFCHLMFLFYLKNYWFFSNNYKTEKFVTFGGGTKRKS